LKIRRRFLSVIRRRPVTQLTVWVVVDLLQGFKDSDSIREDSICEEKGVEKIN
jgi:hypothetical protein